MKTAWQADLEKLIRWADSICNQDLQIISTMPFNGLGFQTVQTLIKSVSNAIRTDHPFHAEQLSGLSGTLFHFNRNGCAFLQPVKFGELLVILRHLQREPVPMAFWQNIHPRIREVAQGLYLDGYHASAAERAIKEVEIRLRKKQEECYPNERNTPRSTQNIIEHLYGQNAAPFRLYDTATNADRDHRLGIRDLLKGFIATYRNPAAHGEVQIGKRQAFELLVLSSQLLHILDRPLAPTPPSQETPPSVSDDPPIEKQGNLT